MNEIRARLKYIWYCLVMEDGSWDMGADYYAPFLFSGFWIKDGYAFKTYKEAMES